ncbi:MAG TPA: heme exporter protein CcmB [Chitinophagales bacterium]|nr:heme exporter protein CcmB [Chitinophagales bacterium]HMY24579.1 heme exporter protein CcmB [Chitinophagales bacterium]HMZ34103.1 heme exporter protein CcmB [Chitinophagales bacterium]HNA40021.1 heme exporter protein CcmB [Chitinophagales bacterium]HNB48838.1 heme exporter protein CcmB [Chitinophagales bacterium]
MVNILKLVRKELQLEWRQKTALGTIFIYVLGTSFLIYLVFQGHITIPVWIALFWVIALFTTVNAVSRSFLKDANEQFYYLRSIATPLEIIFSKIIYNAFLITILSLIIYLVMILFFNENIDNKGLFLLTIILGAIGFSNLFTLLSAITARTQNFVLLAILGIPIILPLLLLIVKMSELSNFAIQQKDIYMHLGAIAMLDVITLILSIVLFPYIWRD